VCSDNWDDSWSALACHQLGFSSVVSTEIANFESGAPMFRLNTSFPANGFGTTLQGALYPVEEEEGATCQGGAVKLECQTEGEEEYN
jgi:hypothetical protein